MAKRNKNGHGQYDVSPGSIEVRRGTIDERPVVMISIVEEPVHCVLAQAGPLRELIRQLTEAAEWMEEVQGGGW